MPKEPVYKTEEERQLAKKQAQAKWKSKNKHTEKYRLGHKNTQLKQKYGIDINYYNLMFTQQNGCCAICKEHQTSVGTLCVDHCHETDIIRGLLCNTCNSALGKFKDNIEILHNAINYLS